MCSEKETVKELIIIDQIIDSFVKNVENINKEKCQFEETRREVCNNYIKKLFGIELEDTIIFKRGKYKDNVLFVERLITNVSVVGKESIVVDDIFFVCRLVNEDGCLSNIPKTFRVKDAADFEKITSVKIRRNTFWYAE